MDVPLKQRMIGAAVLVALAVIFLPMLVSGPDPQSGTSAVPLDIPPPPERNFETRDLPLAPPSSAAPLAQAASDDPNRVVTVDAVPAPRVDALPEAPVASAPMVDAADSTTAMPSTASDVAVATPAPASPAESAPATTPGGRFVVNLGSYGNATNAAALVTAMKGAGLAAYAESTAHDGKPVQRVRIGPYAQRGEAEAARLAATRVRADLPAAVVALETESAAPAPAPVRAPVAAGFAVQLGALKSANDANALRDRARAAGFAAFVERADTEAGPLWRVRAGPEIHRANADRLKASIAQKLGIDGVVVTHP